MPEASLHLSFTGGGARGYAHIGFLKAIEELRYDYRHISRHRTKALGFWDLSPYQSLIHRWLEGARFKDMPLRLFIQATDLTHFRYVIFSARTHPEMEVSFAVRASCTYPCMITPVRYDGAVLMDGGVFVDLRQVRARRIIVSNVSSFGREHREVINSIPKVLMAYLRFREYTSTPPFIFRPGGGSSWSTMTFRPRPSVCRRWRNAQRSSGRRTGRHWRPCGGSSHESFVYLY